MLAKRRGLGRLAAAVGVAILGAVLSVTARAGSLPGFNGKIAFDHNDGTDDEIHVVNADGSGVTNLTDNSARDTEPAWSPDGTQIVFVSNRDGNNEIYVMNADGSGQTRLTTDAADDLEPSWSPDGTQIVFSRDTGDGAQEDAEIYVMNADGTGQTNLTNNSEQDYQPAWSPDGSQIAFVGGRFIHVMDADGTNQAPLTSSTDFRVFDLTPTWSPDGTRIAFMRGLATNTDTWDIHVIGADGSGQVNLTNDSGIDWYPAWSPDGTRIAFSSLGGAGFGLMSMNPDGTGVSTLNGDVSPRAPDWQPITASLSVDDVSITEGNSGGVDAVFTISLSNAVPGTVNVDFTTLEGTASSPSDFALRSGTRTFLPGETVKNVTVPIVTDAWAEGDETFTVRLLDPYPTFIELVDANGVGTITNDDGGTVTPSISISDASVTEGPSGTAAGAAFRVTLSSTSTQAVTVQWSTADGTATAPSDYKAQPPTVLTFEPGIRSRTVKVKVYGDGSVEPNETLFVYLSAPSNATIADGEGVGTILNDD